MDLDTVLAAKRNHARAVRNYYRALMLALSRFGDGPDAVARKLEELGCKGTANRARGCALSAYLSEATEWPVIVGDTNVAAHVDGEWCEWPLSIDVQAFLSLYDLLAYPQLIGGTTAGTTVPVLRWERVA